MKLIDVLNTLPDEMLMMDMWEIERTKRIKSVKELKTKFREILQGDKYHIHTYNTPRRQGAKAIGLKNGVNIFIEADLFDVILHKQCS